jgi:Flp pilus assembly protein TadD
MGIMMSRANFKARRWLLAAVSILPSTVSAQFSSAPPPSSSYPPTVQPIGPADRLAANLLVLAQNPRDVIALTEAGKSALAIGDGNAALSFFAKAEELSPGDSRIKAGIGTALLLLEEPNEAMKLYAEAASLGLPDREFAKDRGLAYDLLGDSHRAQQDYALALKYRPDDEITRRLALSYGLSGERDRGLKLLDPLLKKQDQAAWRARAFILAMNGNLRDAERIVDQVMPVGMGNTMTPFLRRLAGLTPAQRARAVNFGTMPETGIRTAAADTGFRPMDAGAGAQLIPAEAPPVQVAAVDPKAAARLAKAERRRPDREKRPIPANPVQVALNTPPPAQALPTKTDGRLDTRIDTRLGARIGPVDYEKLPPEFRAAIKQPETVKGNVVQPGALPPPDQVRKPVTASPFPPPATTAPVVASRPSEPPPLFEIPPSKVVIAPPPPPPPPLPARPIATPPASVVVQSPAPAALPKPTAAPPASVVFQSPAPKPTPVVPSPVQVATTPVTQPASSVIFAPPPPPTIRTIDALPSSVAAASTGADVTPKPVAVSPSAPPVQVALASPPPPSLMGPPAPEQTSTAFPPVTSLPATSPVTSNTDLLPAAAKPEIPAAAPADVAIVTPSPKPPVTGLAGLLADIKPEEESAAAPLPTAAELRAIRLAAQKRALAEAEAKASKDKAVQEAKLAKDKAAKESAEKAAAAKKSPARIWVQVATGANEAGLPGTWKRLKEKAPDVFKGHSASVVPFRATNRVLVGPFKSQAEARAMLNAMGKAGIQGSSYASEAGQEVARIASK